MRPKLCGHDDASFADAVVTAVDRDLGRADRRNVNDYTCKVFARLALFDHPAGDQLCEKIRALEIDSDYTIEASFGRIENVCARFGRYTRIVDEHIEPAEMFADLGNNLLSIIRYRDIAAAVDDASTAACERCKRFSNLGFFTHAIDREIVTFIGEHRGNAEANASAATSDECHSLRVG